MGLFELAIDAVTTWRTPKGNTAKPLIVASSATVRNAVELVRQAKKRGVQVTAEVTPQHLIFTDEVLRTFETR